MAAIVAGTARSTLIGRGAAAARDTRGVIGPGIVIPLVLLAVLLPAGIWIARRRLRPDGSDTLPEVTGTRLTSSALRGAAVPPRRVVLEVPPDRLDGVEHVLVCPAGIYAVVTTMEPLPHAGDTDVGTGGTAVEAARAAVMRSRLDELLARCATSSTSLVTVHWGRTAAGVASIEVAHGHVAVDGHRLGSWIDSLPDDRLTPNQIDLAWRTVTTGVGRPDPG